MANKKPSALTAATALDGTEIFHGVQGGNSRKVTANQIKTLALAPFGSNGLAVRTAAEVFAARTIVGTTNEITVTNGSGVAGDPTISLPTALTFTGKTVTGGTFTGITDIAVADGGTGASTAAGARTNLGLVIGTDVQTQRTITGTANEITVADGNGVSGNPTLSLPTGLTFTGKTVTGGSITPAATPTTTAIGYLGCPVTTHDATYTTVMADAGTALYHTSGSAHSWTIDSNANVAYPVGTILTFINESGGGNVTIAITSDTLRWGSSTGSRTLAANGVATAIKVSSTVWRLTGDGIS